MVRGDRRVGRRPAQAVPGAAGTRAGTGWIDVPAVCALRAGTALARRPHEAAGVTREALLLSVVDNLVALFPFCLFDALAGCDLRG